MVEWFYCPECDRFEWVGYAERKRLSSFDKAYMVFAQKYGCKKGSKMAAALYVIFKNNRKSLERTINVLDDKVLDLMEKVPRRTAEQAIKLLEKGDYKRAVAKLIVSCFWR